MKHLPTMRFFCLILPLFGLLLPLAANGADPRNRNVVCLGHGNSTSINSNYEANIHSLAAMLRAETSASAAPGLYADHVVGDHPDGVYAVSRCRNGTDSSSCRACVTLALQAARTACPYHREFMFFNGNCSLRLLPRVHFDHPVIVLDYSPETKKRNIVMRDLSLAMVFQAIGFTWLFFLLLLDSRNRKSWSEMSSSACHLKTSNQSAHTEFSESAPSFNGSFPTST